MSDIVFRVKKDGQVAAIERANKRNDRAKGRMEEGSIFGGRSVRAGSINSQYRSHSPTPSYVPSPTVSIVKLDQKGERIMGMHSNAGSVVPLMANLRAKSKPSPLRLQLSDAELSERFSNGPSASFDATGGTYLPPLAASHLPLSTEIANSSPSTGWASPPDFHLIRPSVPGTGSSPGSAVSSVYRFPFPGVGGKVNRFTPASAASIPRSNSDSSSTHSSTTTSSATNNFSISPEASPCAYKSSAWEAATGPKYPEPVRVSPKFSPFPYSSYPTRQESRSDPSSVGANNHYTSGTSNQMTPLYDQFTDSAPRTQNFHLPLSPLGDTNDVFDDDDAGVIRHSVVSRRTVSVHPALRSPRFDSLPLSPMLTDAQAQSQRRLSTSSIHSAKTSIVIESESDDRFSRTSSYSMNYEQDIEADEMSQSMPREPGYLTTTHFTDSLRGDNEYSSQQSPFSDTHEIGSQPLFATQSNNLTVPHIQDRAQSFVLELNLPENTYSFAEPGRDSISDLYDTYYRRSTASRLSVASVAPNPRISAARSSVNTIGNGRRPPPLKFDGGFGGDAITEVNSPVSSRGYSQHDEMANMI